ncbi:MAG: hypothetical protein JWN04_1537 [Myxococcaceae bacterium]|nr:hypothetical protein [Myxococcaceae bacterium]
MFPRLRITLLSSALGLVPLLCTGAALAGRSHVSAQDHAVHAPEPAGTQVFKYRGANGRDVFTNAGNVAISGAAPSAMTLPELLSVDFGGASLSQLQSLDHSVQLAHDALQTGRRCAAIRASLRVPVSSFVWGENPRQVCVGAGLLVLAILVLATWRGRLKQLMPLAPLLGSLYLGYDTYARVDRRLSALREGLHACSSDLPPAQASNPEVVKSRLSSAASVQATVDHAYDQRAKLVESYLRER